MSNAQAHVALEYHSKSHSKQGGQTHMVLDIHQLPNVFTTQAVLCLKPRATKTVQAVAELTRSEADYVAAFQKVDNCQIHLVAHLSISNLHRISTSQTQVPPK